MKLEANDIVQWLINVNREIQEHKDYLSRLDRPIGDGDHGINMARGFRAVEERIKNTEYVTASEVLKDTAFLLISKVGGASGPLFGTAFLKMSTELKKSNTSFDDRILINSLDKAVQGVMELGKAKVGEKTMVDVWHPVVDCLKQEGKIQPEQLSNVANKAMKSTKKFQATKGRAAYFKEASVGHIDPGSASSFLIFESLAKMLKEKK